MVNCSKCHKEFPSGSSVAAISGSISGDEVCDAYYLCPDCDVYTVVTWWDDFTGVESTSTKGPIPRAEGDKSVALIRKCPTAWDKKCRCQAHMEYFCGTLD
jgi:hypothetical protein